MAWSKATSMSGPFPPVSGRTLNGEWFTALLLQML